MTSFESREIAIVTGSNRGIGFACLKGILTETKIPKVIMTTRKAANGEKAKLELLKLFSSSDVDRVIIAEMDLGSNESMDKFSVWLKETYGGFNILINNAGIASELNQNQQTHVEKLVDTVNTNYGGTAYLMEKLYPLAFYNARIVMVSSVFGIRGMFQINANPNKHDGLNDVEVIGSKLFSTNGSVPIPTELEQFKNKFISDWKAGNHLWPTLEKSTLPGYDMSKLLLNALVRYYSKLQVTKEKRILINGVCPGFCGTDLNSMIPIDKPKTPEDGAESILSMALLPYNLNKPNGSFLMDI